MNEFTALTDAQEIVLDAAVPLGCEKIGLLDALGRVLGEDVVAPRDHPPWDNSAMDGFAVRWEDIRKTHEIARPAELTIIEDVPAGRAAANTVGPGEAVRIMTGAPVPGGADTVVRVEFTESSGETVRIFQPEPRHANVRPRGEDVGEGDCIMPQGTLLRPAELGMLAMLAKPFVPVYQRPRVAVLATGDELADLDEKFDERKIVNSNSYGLAAAVQEAGGIPLLLGIAHDTPESLKEKIARAAGCDVLVLSGGVSMGDYDFTKVVFEELGADMHFWKLAIRPGQPLAFGGIGGALAFGLPGNPVSSMVTFEQLVRPAIMKMGGHRRTARPSVRAEFQERFSKRPDRRHFLRGILEHRGGKLIVRTTGPQGSGMLTSMVKANGLIDVPEAVETLAPGDTVQVQVLSGNF